MADLNQVYAPTTDFVDPDTIVGYLPGTFPWSDKTPIYLPDELRQQIRQTNADAVATAQAVKVPFSGSTSDERAKWVLSTLQAVDNRVEFIKQRSNQLLSSLQGDDVAYNAALKIFETGLSLLPGIGSAITYISNQQAQQDAINTVKIQSLIQGYAGDLQQLAQIRAQLYKEYAGDATTNDPTALAPTVIPTWYYYAGAGLLLLLLILIIRNRNQSTKRSRR